MTTKGIIVSRCAWTLSNFRLNLVSSAKNQGVDVSVAGSDQTEFTKVFTEQGIGFHSIDFLNLRKRKFNSLRLLWDLFVLYRKERPDFVHHFTIRPVLIGSIAAKLARVPRIYNTITGLGYSFVSAPQWMQKLLLIWYRVAFRFSHRVFFQNETDRDFFIEHSVINFQKCEMIAGSGVDISRFSIRMSEKPFETPLVFMMVARLIREKGVLEYLNAAKGYLKISPQTQFWLVGGPDPANPTCLSDEDLLEFKKVPGIRFLGHIDDLAPLYKEADFVVLPSYREGLSRSLLEAAASGKPLIASDVPGCRELVNPNKNGILVKARSISALVSAFEWANLNKNRLVEMGRNSRLIVEEKYDEKLVIRQTVAHYRPVA